MNDIFMTVYVVEYDPMGCEFDDDSYVEVLESYETEDKAISGFFGELTDCLNEFILDNRPTEIELNRYIHQYYTNRRIKNYRF